jgi:site-specific DNA-cytosine methylase
VKNEDKIILDLCGGTGAWSKPYKDAGYDVRVITLPMFDVTDPYIIEQCIRLKPYGILAAPPCTIFSKANWRKSKEQRNYTEGMKTVISCLNIIWGVQQDGAPLKFWALENPEGYLYNHLGYPYYKFQPWQFGEIGMLATKRTSLWGFFKKPKKMISKRPLLLVPHIKERQNHKWYGASAKERAITPAGFAKAFFKANK